MFQAGKMAQWVNVGVWRFRGGGFLNGARGAIWAQGAAED